jgi:hypothetical protein
MKVSILVGEIANGSSRTLDAWNALRSFSVDAEVVRWFVQATGKSRRAARTPFVWMVLRTRV